MTDTTVNPEDKKVEVETEEAVEVEIIDDAPEADRGKPRSVAGEEPKTPDEDEIAQYGEKVQKRMKDMSFQIHSERRAREDSERMLGESAKLNDLQRKRIGELSDVIDSGRKEMSDVETTGEKGRLEAAQKAFESAFDAGDAPAMTKASTEIASATAVLERIKTVRSQDDFILQQRQAQAQARPQQPMPQYRPPPPDQAAVEWNQRNLWFQNDERMTAVAMGIHQEMTRSGVQIGTDDYYKRLDSEMARVFPSFYGESDNDQSASRGKPGSVVAPASRGGGNKPRGKIRLTASQVALAEKMGLTPQRYAEEMSALEGGSP